MRKFDLPLIFYFVIYNLIFMSHAKSFYTTRQEIEKGREFMPYTNVKSMQEDNKKFHGNGNYLTRIAPYDDYEQAMNENEELSGNFPFFNNAKFQYNHNRIQTRDANRQKAAQATAAATTDILNETNTINQNNNKSKEGDSDLSKTFINNTFDERPAASTSSMTNNKSSELANVIGILDEMREELELMRMSKMQCNQTPDGSNCDVNGAWNSEQIGLRFELATSLTNDKLTVNLSDKAPKKVKPFRIDASWSCSGTALHSVGGPIVFFCRKAPMENLIIFQGLCKKCSGYETIFGKWHFQNTPHDCRQLWTFVESRNDVFRKDVLHHKSHQQHDNVDINQVNEKSMNGSTVGILNKSKVRRNIKSNHHKLKRKSNQDFLK